MISHLTRVLRQIRDDVATTTAVDEDGQETTLESVEISESDLENPPARWQASIVLLPGDSDPVRTGEGRDPFDDSATAGSVSAIRHLRGVSIEFVKRGKDVEQGMELAAACQSVLELSDGIASLVDEFHYTTAFPVSGKPENEPFVLIALVVYFQYLTARGDPWRRIGGK